MCEPAEPPFSPRARGPQGPHEVGALPTSDLQTTGAGFIRDVPAASDHSSRGHGGERLESTSRFRLALFRRPHHVARPQARVPERIENSRHRLLHRRIPARVDEQQIDVRSGGEVERAESSRGEQGEARAGERLEQRPHRTVDQARAFNRQLLAGDRPEATGKVSIECGEARLQRFERIQGAGPACLRWRLVPSPPCGCERPARRGRPRSCRHRSSRSGRT